MSLPVHPVFPGFYKKGNFNVFFELVIREPVSTFNYSFIDIATSHFVVWCVEMLLTVCGKALISVCGNA